MHLSAGFAVTGASDRKLGRVWPLDFASHFLEAALIEGPVTAVHESPDGLKLLIGTASGTIGVLDVPTLKHATIVRSHTTTSSTASASTRTTRLRDGTPQPSGARRQPGAAR